MDVLPLWLLLPIMMILILMAPQPTQALATRSKLNPRVVQTRYGKIQGLVLSFENTRHLKPIDVYLGVPYATPPTGGNRFSPTRALSPWDGNKLAEKLGPVCPQKLPDISDEKEALDRMPRGRLEYLKRILPHLRNQSEDCLYLNIYAPAMGMSEGGRKHPVLVFIHGESYEWGSGNTYDGSVLASYTDQIVITLNYRLGVLGFLNANVSPHTKARVANYGLMDQIAALHWVQQNIEYFGGDPSNVTLMGQGTGAACVNFLAISPTVMPGLFKRAILLSGSALSSWAVVEEPVSYALKLAEAVNCSVPKDLLKDHELLVDCLRESSLEALLRADVRPPTFLSAFGPSVDGVVIKPDFQKDLLSYLGPEFQGFGILPKKAEHGEAITSNNKYDLLFGVTTSEALWRFAERDVEKGFEGERRDRIIRTYVRNAYMYHLTEIFYTIVNEYTDWERTVQHPMNTRDACVQALSDAQFVAPLVQTGDLFTLRHTKRPNGMHVPLPVHDADKEPLPKTYFYVFDYQMKDGDYPQRMGSVHGEELPFVFGAPLVDGFGHFPRNYTKAETQLSESIIQYFANFVRTGHETKNEEPLPSAPVVGLAEARSGTASRRHGGRGAPAQPVSRLRGPEPLRRLRATRPSEQDRQPQQRPRLPTPRCWIGGEKRDNRAAHDDGLQPDHVRQSHPEHKHTEHSQRQHGHAREPRRRRLRDVLDGSERDDSDRLQSPHPERSHLRWGLLPARQDATRGEELATAADDEPAVRAQRFQRPQAATPTATPAHALSRRWSGHRRRGKRDDSQERDEDGAA
ncbi:neuroligin-4, Y-linked isoform X3 [Nasonia vitripennis]|uniref:Carboxylesterase type B domain-containing protein n=1 Tax=Nasonia vitripennis TaxID=7425 RepID=A0A7M7QC67_NASVI|nr:neuroligin-4, Y-linked isoform X3 [Nasonia vitripennis]